MNRVPAFTLLEVVLALFLVALLGSFTFFILQNMRISTSTLNDNSSEQQELLFLNTAVRTDMDRATALHVAFDGSLDLIVEEGTINYSLTKEGVSRVLPDGVIAVFKLPVIKAEAFTLAHDIPLVHLWRLTLGSDDQQKVAAYQKTYSLADRIRQQSAHGN